MKFTEGYWLESERANGLFAAQAYYVQPIPAGMRITAPTRMIAHRGDTLNTPTITIELRACAPDVIAVKAWHHEAYDRHLPAFEKDETALDQDGFSPKLQITDEEAVLDAGRVRVRVDRMHFRLSFEAEGRTLTTCGYKNLGLIRWNRRESTVLPQEGYLTEEYDPYMLAELSLSVGECVYGLGERFSAFVKNGQSIDTWNEDGGTSSQIAYKSIPFYMTNKGYGIFVDSTDRVSFECASEKVEYVGISVPGEQLSWYFFYGPEPRRILQQYTALTGRPALPPAWSFGLWLSTSFTTQYDEETAGAFIDGMAKRDIPLSVFHFDCFWMKAFRWCDFEWDADCFPDVRGMLRRYHEKGLKICVWINPYIAQGTPFFREAVKNGYLLQRADGKGTWQTDHWQAGMGLVDFTNPAAVRWYTDKLGTLLDDGVDCFKTDFGERIPVNVRYYDGSDPQAMHNYYTFLYNQAVFSLLRERKGVQEAVVFARSATAGSQRFPVHWGGDCFADYPSMAETLRGGLSFAMSGFSFWSHDISGFESTASPDLYKRWAAFGLLSTHSRLHGSGSYRVPWLFDEEASEVVAFFAGLKCALMPYLYARAIEAHETGMPVMRPMVMEYPEDPACAYLDRQYLLGEALLAAPVFSEDGTCSFYLPEGVWTHLLDGSVRTGGRWYSEKYSYFSLPLFVRENTLLPVGTNRRQPDYPYADHVSLRLYQPAVNVPAVCPLPMPDGRIVNTVTAMMTEDGLHVSMTGKTGELEITVYCGEQVKQYRIPAAREEENNR